MTAAAKSSVARDTVVLERTYRAAPDQVFRAWENVEARARWSKPWPEMDLVYDRHEFRVGGKDTYRCGLDGHFNWAAEIQYLDIVRDRRLIYSERMAEEGRPQSAALIAVEFFAKGKETLQVITIDILTLDGSGMLEGYAGSWAPVLDNLGDEFR
ncbi:MAG TPA: SRPBCC domain-containing protein [Hyphomonadaceae bacterium]|nr:SRPBCC domain-containing protein [Hyphomonadaceae bacterium]